MQALLRTKPRSSFEVSCQWLWGVMGVLAIWLGFPSLVPSLPPLVLLWPLALWRLGLLASSQFLAFRNGLLVSWMGMLAALYWLTLPVSQVGGLPWPLAWVCAALIAFVLATQGGLFAWTSRFLRQYAPWRQAVLLALLWYLLEFAYARLAGFPWLPLSAALAQWPVLIQSAVFVGAYLMGAFWLIGIFLIYAGRKFPGFCVIILLLAYGTWQLADDSETSWPSGSDTLTALMVEGNVDQNQKWTLPFQERSLADYLRLTAAGLQENEEKFAGERPLVLWPETALPFFYEKNDILAARLARRMKELGCPLLFGAPGVERGKNGEELLYNRAFLLNAAGERIGHYDKEHLVPFGEYVPAWLKLDFLEALLQGVGVYEAGTDADILPYGKVAIGVLICYEGIFPWLAQDRVAAGANILVDISNDGWFGLSPASRQHLYLTVLRCVEQGRWLLRSTNTGISAVVDARGRVVMRGGQFEAGSMACRGRLLDDWTVYHEYAALWPWAAALLLLLLWVTGGKAHVSVE